MNSQIGNAALKRIRYYGKLVAYRLRSIASAAMNEANFHPDIVEAVLAHNDKMKYEVLILAQNIWRKEKT